MKLITKAILGCLLATCIVNVAVAFDATEYQEKRRYQSVKRLSLGWFKTLTEEQTKLYFDSQIVALGQAQNGQRVEWVKGDASGYSVPLETRVVSSDKTCRVLMSKVFAFNIEETFTGLACHDNYQNQWEWVKTY